MITWIQNVFASINIFHLYIIVFHSFLHNPDINDKNIHLKLHGQTKVWPFLCIHVIRLTNKNNDFLTDKIYWICNNETANNETKIKHL